MTIQLRPTLERITIALVAATLAVGLFATGVWAGLHTGRRRARVPGSGS